jgi:hypothetical protein
MSLETLRPRQSSCITMAVVDYRLISFQGWIHSFSSGMSFGSARRCCPPLLLHHVVGAVRAAEPDAEPE